MAKLLIVDDSATARSIAASLIGGAYEIKEAGSGQAALDLLAAEAFDIVLLDLLMPGMGGIEVLTELGLRSSTVPVIVATADIQNSTRTRALALGAVAIVNKPLRKDSLGEALDLALRLGGPAPVPSLEPLLMDAFAELMNVAIGRAAQVLNTMLSSPIALSVPAIELISPRELSARFSPRGGGRLKLSAVEMRCSGGLEASIELIFTSEDARRLADCVMGAFDSGKVERDSMRAGALCEIGNIVINAVLGTISNALEIDLSFSIPCYLEGEASALVDEISLAKKGVQGVILLVKTRFEVEDLHINGDIALFLSLGSFEVLADMLRGRSGGGQ